MTFVVADVVRLRLQYFVAGITQTIDDRANDRRGHKSQIGDQHDDSKRNHAHAEGDAQMQWNCQGQHDGA